MRRSLPLALLALSLPALLQAAPKATPAAKPPKGGAVAAATPLPAGEKPITEQDLLKALDTLKMGDPIKARPLSSEPPAPSTIAPPSPAVLSPVGAPPLTTTPSTTEPATVAPTNRPAPTPRPPTPTNPDGSPKAGGNTEITANEGTFDQKGHVGVFIRDVVVDNPQFHITCDKLTVYMRPDEPKAGADGAAAKPGSSPAAKPSGKAATPSGSSKTGATPGASGKKGDDKGGAQSKLQKAIAEGNVVITQDKVDADGNVTHSTGHGMKAVYDSDTGDITLSGRPDVSQGINTLEATDDSTVIIMNREGRMHAVGPHKSTIRDTSSADPTQPTQKGKEKAAQPQ